MRGKELIVSFFLVQILDVLTTVIGINFFDLSEANPVAQSWFNALGMEQFLVIKIYITSFFIGLYLLTLKKYKKWNWALEKAFQVGTLGMWVIVFLNLVAIIGVGKVLIGS